MAANGVRGAMKESHELLQEDDSRTSSSSSSVPNDQVEGYELRDIGIIVEAGPSGINADAPPLVLDPPTVPASIQAVQIKAMKSKAVEQIQAMLRKRRTKNKEDWKKNMQFVVVIVLALVGLLFTTIGVLLQVKYSDKILSSIPAYFWLYLVAVYIFSAILCGPLARMLVNMWRFSFFYENYIYYYTHGTVRGLHIALAAAIPWIYWEYFAAQSVGETREANFRKNTQWVTRIYQSLIVLGACLIGKQVLVRVLAGNIQAIKEHISAVLFLEKVLSYLTGKYINDKLLTVKHSELISSIKNVEKGAPALHLGKQKQDKTFFQKYFAHFLLRGAGIKSPKLRSKHVERKEPVELSVAAENMARKIFARMDKDNNGFLTVENFKQEIQMDTDLAKSTYAIFDRNGDGFVSQQELAAVIEEVYIHRRSLQHSLKDTKNLERSLEEVVTAIFFLIGFVGILIVFGVDVQASILSFSVGFFSLGFALGPFLQQLIYCIVLVFFVKPFDVGDRISIASDSEVLIVESIGLWMTDTLDGSGKRHYLHNGNLAKEHIVNHTRTSRVDISLQLDVSLDISADDLNTIKETLLEWSRTDPNLLQPPNVNVSSVNVEKNMIAVSLSCGLNCSWFDPRRGKARQEFVDLVYQLIRQLGISSLDTPPATVVRIEKDKDSESVNNKEKESKKVK